MPNGSKPPPNSSSAPGPAWVPFGPGSTRALLGAIFPAAAVDDQVDAQPLLMQDEAIAGGLHDVLYVVTKNNSVYALLRRVQSSTPYRRGPSRGEGLSRIH